MYLEKFSIKLISAMKLKSYEPVNRAHHIHGCDFKAGEHMYLGTFLLLPISRYREIPIRLSTSIEKISQFTKAEVVNIPSPTFNKIDAGIKNYSCTIKEINEKIIRILLHGYNTWEYIFKYEDIIFDD